MTGIEVNEVGTFILTHVSLEREPKSVTLTLQSHGPVDLDALREMLVEHVELVASADFVQLRFK